MSECVKNPVWITQHNMNQLALLINKSVGCSTVAFNGYHMQEISTARWNFIRNGAKSPIGEVKITHKGSMTIVILPSNIAEFKKFLVNEHGITDKIHWLEIEASLKHFGKMNFKVTVLPNYLTIVKQTGYWIFDPIKHDLVYVENGISSYTPAKDLVGHVVQRNAYRFDTDLFYKSRWRFVADRETSNVFVYVANLAR